MLFNSFEFLLFFPLVTLLYYLLPYRLRWLLLLSASCFFYMYFIPVYILILFVTILIDYVAGIAIENTSDKKRKKLYLVLSIISNVGMLAFFKYFNFLVGNANGILGAFDQEASIPYLAILLPVGLSFHTFQAMSYTFEVYRGKFKAERHLGIYALYVMYYPQLVAGPIERPQNVLPQLKTEQKFDFQNFRAGLLRILWGLFKKVVIADRIAHFINPMFNSPEQYEGWQLLCAAYLFSFQIYLDFSAYTDIALGASRCMGIKLMENFRLPYFAKSIREFWSRWHISLSTWFRDYLYIPLGGSRKGKWILFRNILIVFLLSGLWHGATWNFVLWGGIHGFFLLFALASSPIFQSIEKFLSKIKMMPVYNLLRIVFCFHLVTLAWVFFRATDFQSSVFILSKISSGTIATLQSGISYFELLNMQKNFIGLILLIPLAIVFIIEKISAHRKVPSSNMALYSIFILLIVFISIMGQSTKEQFIYFQF